MERKVLHNRHIEELRWWVGWVGSEVVGGAGGGEDSWSMSEQASELAPLPFLAATRSGRPLLSTTWLPTPVSEEGCWPPDC